MKNSEKMKLITTSQGYDFYRTYWHKPYYNVVKTGDPTPGGGYYSADYICKTKGVKNVF